MPDEACKEGYEQVKKRKIRAATFGFNPKRTAIIPKDTIEKTEDFKADWEKMQELLPPKDALYFVYDFEFKDFKSGYNDGDEETAPIKSKMALFSWAPDNAKPQVKMLVPSSLAGIKQLCDAAQHTIQLNSMDQTSYEEVCKSLGV